MTSLPGLLLPIAINPLMRINDWVSCDESKCMIQLHYYPSTVSMAPHILLRELGVPFEVLLVDRTQNAQKMTVYLQLNPNGLIPVLTEENGRTFTNG